MKSLFQNICRGDEAQQSGSRTVGGGGRASFPCAEGKQFTSCSRCLLLKPAARIRRRGRAPKLAGAALSRRLGRAQVCEAPRAGTGPSARQAGSSGALPCGLGSHSHPWTAGTRPLPGPRQPSARRAPQAGARGPEVPRGPRRRRELPREPGAGPASQRRGRPLAAAAAAPFCSSSSLLPAAHTTPT